MTEVKVPRSHWRVECHDAQGNEKWVEEFCNLVTDAGINDLLAQYFKGSGYTASWFVGLVNAPATYAAADTMAAHGGWTENTNYSAVARPSLTLGSVGNKSVDNSAAKATFTMSGAGGTIAGTFLVTNSTKGGTNGILYAEASFTSGNKVVVAGDVLTITVSLTGA